VLVVTTTVGMLDGVLGNTTDLGPAVALDGVLVVGTARLEKGLVGTSATGDDADLGTDVGLDGLLSAGGEAKTCGALVLVVGDDDGEAAGATGEGTTVTYVGLDVADNGTLGDRGEGQDVAALKRGLLAAVDELAGVHALSSDEELGIALVAVGVQELDLGDGSTTSGVMDDVLDDAADVALLLGVVKGTKLHGALAGAGVSLEDGGLTLTLGLLFSSVKSIHSDKRFQHCNPIAKGTLFVFNIIIIEKSKRCMRVEGSSTFEYALSTDEVVASHHGTRQGAIVKREQPLSSNPCQQDFHQNSFKSRRRRPMLGWGAGTMEKCTCRRGGRKSLLEVSAMARKRMEQKSYHRRAQVGCHRKITSKRFDATEKGGTYLDVFAHGCSTGTD